MQKNTRVGAQHDWAATDELIKFNEALEDGEVFLLHGGPSALARVECAASDVKEAEVLVEDGVDGAFALAEYSGPIAVGRDEAVAGGAA